MCGRYTSDGLDVAKVAERFDAQKTLEEFAPNHNIKPTQAAPIVVEKDGEREIQLMQWGLIPFWAKDPKIGSKMFNARSETVGEKPAFKSSFKRKRCLVPATGFYEWKAEGRGKVPYLFTVGDHEVFGFAGLYDSWKAPSGEVLYTYTIITTRPNDLVAQAHDRMPVILPRDQEQAWLDTSVEDPFFLQSLLEPYPADLMQMSKVEGKL
ncbi:MAG TPA: SOS response-associated peptidase [Herpetosiphonaceae bacterium]